MKLMKLTEKQLIAVKYYEGDVTGDDAFWGDPKAYVTLNSLFYPGIDTETRRAKEGKRLNPAITADVDRLIELCRDLLSAFEAPDLSKPRKTFRVERYADYLQMKNAGGTLSFTSTSTGGFLKYYTDRVGIALMEFEIPSDMPCFPFAEMLNEGYLKTEEEEILLPPGLRIDYKEISLSESDREITDAQGNTPLVKCQAIITGHLPFESYSCGLDIRKELPPVSKRIYDSLNSEAAPDPKDVEIYIQLKKELISLIFQE